MKERKRKKERKKEKEIESRKLFSSLAAEEKKERSETITCVHNKHALARSFEATGEFPQPPNEASRSRKKRKKEKRKEKRNERKKERKKKGKKERK